MNKKEQEIKPTDLWIGAAKAYLSTSDILLKEIQGYLDRGITLNDHAYLIIPAVFCLKQGIELYLKAILKMIKPDYNPKKDGHNIEKIFNTLFLSLRELKDDKKGKIKEIEGVLCRMKLCIIMKYFNGKYIYTSKEEMKKSGFKSILDKYNTAERYYPEKSGDYYNIPDSIIFQGRGESWEDDLILIKEAHNKVSTLKPYEGWLDVPVFIVSIEKVRKIQEDISKIDEDLYKKVIVPIRRMSEKPRKIEK